MMASQNLGRSDGGGRVLTAAAAVAVAVAVAVRVATLG